MARIGTCWRACIGRGAPASEQRWFSSEWVRRWPRVVKPASRVTGEHRKRWLDRKLKARPDVDWQQAGWRFRWLAMLASLGNDPPALGEESAMAELQDCGSGRRGLQQRNRFVSCRHGAVGDLRPPASFFRRGLLSWQSSQVAGERRPFSTPQLVSFSSGAGAKRSHVGYPYQNFW